MSAKKAAPKKAGKAVPKKVEKKATFFKKTKKGDYGGPRKK